MEIVDAMVEFGLSATIHTEATIRGRVWQVTCHLTKDRDPEEAPDFGAALAAAARALAAEMDDLAVWDWEHGDDDPEWQERYIAGAAKLRGLALKLETEKGEAPRR